MIEETRAEWEAQAGARAADERNRAAREGASTWPDGCPVCGAPWRIKSKTMGAAAGQPHQGTCENGHRWYEIPATVSHPATTAVEEEGEDWREAARRRAAENGPVDAAAVAAALALADPAPFPTLEGDPGVLTPDEHEAMRLTTDLANLLGRIVGPGTTRQSDLAEVIVPLHVIQRYVMAQAAARAYPTRYRPLGGWFE